MPGIKQSYFHIPAASFALTVVTDAARARVEAQLLSQTVSGALNSKFKPRPFARRTRLQLSRHMHKNTTYNIQIHYPVVSISISIIDPRPLASLQLQSD